MNTEFFSYTEAAGVAAFLFGCLCAYLGKRRDAVAIGFLLGFLFGPIGVIAMLIIDNRPRCPECSGRVDRGARICPHCRTSLAWTGRVPVNAAEQQEAQLQQTEVQEADRQAWEAGLQQADLEYHAKHSDAPGVPTSGAGVMDWLGSHTSKKPPELR